MMSEKYKKELLDNFEKLTEEGLRSEMQRCYKTAQEYSNMTGTDSCPTEALKYLAKGYKASGDFYSTLYAKKIGDCRFDPNYQEQVENMIESAKSFCKLAPKLQIDWKSIQEAAGMGDWGPFYQLMANIHKERYGKDSVLYTFHQQQADNYIDMRDKKFEQQLAERDSKLHSI